MMVLCCDALVLDFDELVCNHWVSRCRDLCALDDVLDEVLGGFQDGVLDDDESLVREVDNWEWSCSSSCGVPALEVGLEGLAGRWTCPSSSKSPQD